MQVERVAACISCGKTANEGDVFCSECRATLLDPRFAPTATDKDSAVKVMPWMSTQQSQNDALIGYVLENRYRLETELGRGGMGAVYRATRLLIGDQVAVKILHPDRVTDPQASERFRREAQAAARLKHPNVVGVYDFGVTNDGLFYLVTELVEGQSLRQLLSEKRTLPAATAIEIITQVCAALDEAHQHQIIHRDIKPDNIIVNQTLAGWRVKVLDFGIAKLRDQGAENLTQTSNVMGTPHYMSPEQCLGEELDARSDVYSAGIVLYEMLCGGVPFNSPISTAVVVQHVNQIPPSLRAINASIPAPVEAIVMRALAKQRDARPQTAGALAQALSVAVRGIVPTPPATGQQAHTTMPFAAHSGRVDTPGYTPTMVMSAGARSQTGAVSSQPGKSTFSMPLLFVSVLLAIVAGSAFTYFLLRDDKTEASAATQNTAPRKAETPATKTSSVPTTVSNPPPNASQTVPVKRPANARRFAFCQYIGVNVRVSPTRDSMLVTTIGKNQGVWVMEESSNYDTFVIKSEEREVTDNWSRIELADDPSVRGWVFSGFISKE